MCVRDNVIVLNLFPERGEPAPNYVAHLGFLPPIHGLCTVDQFQRDMQRYSAARCL